MLLFLPISGMILGAEPDNDLLERCIAEVATGDTNALAALYEETKNAVYGFALSILKNAHDAEDVLHDCYVNLWSAAAGYRSSGKPMAWIITIAKHLAVSKLREQTKTDPLPEEERSLTLAEREDLTAEDQLILTEYMQQLRTEERQIITLHAVGGFKHREISDLLKLPLSTVLSKYRRGLKKLKEIYEKEGRRHDK